MKSKTFVVLVFALFAAGCMSFHGFPAQTKEETEKIPSGGRIEISLAPGSYSIEEVEFHVKKSSLPPEIVQRAKEEMPGCIIGDCEIEYMGGTRFFEVSCKVKGLDQEVMFTEGGEVYSWEAEVRQSEIPPEIVEVAKGAVEGAHLRKCEKILGKDKTLEEYHFKLDKSGVKYKAVVSVDGELMQVFRETYAEIEVPMK